MRNSLQIFWGFSCLLFAHSEIGEWSPPVCFASEATAERLLLPHFLCPRDQTLSCLRWHLVLAVTEQPQRECAPLTHDTWNNHTSQAISVLGTVCTRYLRLVEGCVMCTLIQLVHC